jgi:hypothetical protein
VVDEPVYIWNEETFTNSPGAGHTLSTEIDTRVAKKVSIVCNNLTSTNMQIVITGFNTSNGTMPVVIATLDLDTVTATGGFTTSNLFPYTRITVTNLDTVNAGVVTVNYVITR